MLCCLFRGLSTFSRTVCRNPHWAQPCQWLFLSSVFCFPSRIFSHADGDPRLSPPHLPVSAGPTAAGPPGSPTDATLLSSSSCPLCFCLRSGGELKSILDAAHMACVCMCMSMCVCLCVCVCVCACACMCVCLCVHTCIRIYWRVMVLMILGAHIGVLNSGSHRPMPVPLSLSTDPFLESREHEAMRLPGPAYAFSKPTLPGGRV